MHQKLCFFFGFNADENGLICMASECLNTYLMAELKEILDPAQYTSLEKKIADVNLAKAGLHNLKSCRVCNEVYHVDAGLASFTCCSISQCIICGDELGKNHLERVCIGRFPTLEDRLSSAVVRRCPTCALQIEKSDGCNEMTCSNCRTKFGYLCRAPINHFCRCRFNEEDKSPCTCGRRCIQFEDANKYDAEIISRIKAGSNVPSDNLPSNSNAFGIPVIVIDDDTDEERLTAAERRIQNDARDVRGGRTGRRFYDYDVTLKKMLMFKGRERERGLPQNQEMVVPHRAIGAPDVEALTNIYGFLSSPLPRNPEMFADFRQRVNHVWRNRIERYFNVPDNYMDERRRYLRYGRNGFALFLFERIRIVGNV